MPERHAIEPLVPHLSTPPGSPFALRAGVVRHAVGIRFRYEIDGDIAALRVPGRSALPALTHLLWKHTCFEAFLTGAPGGAYHEFNFSPSGDFAVYAFRGYRDGATVPDVASPAIGFSCSADRLVLSADVSLAPGAGIEAAGPVHVGLCAVLEESDGRISYWALRHPSEKADFHHAAGYALQLDPPMRGDRGNVT